MRAKMFEIRWHWHDEKKCPTPVSSPSAASPRHLILVVVFSVDLAPYDESTWRLASAGGDHTVKMWRVSHTVEEEGSQIDFLAELSRGHTAAVNCVRFSPDGTKLASGGDDNVIMIWTLEQMLKMGSPGSQPAETLDEIGSVERWRIATVLRRHSEDVYDLAWSPNSTQLLSGSVDTTCVIWDVESGQAVDHLQHHQHFVQGVAWHPENKCIVTQSCDRTCSVVALEPPKEGAKSSMYTAGKSLLKNARRVNQKFRAEHDDADTTRLTEPLYVDEAKTSFFRRLTISPDGKLLLTPAGRYTNKSGDEIDTVFIYKMSSPQTPIMKLSGLPSTVVAVRCCPVLFETRPDNAEGCDSPFKGLASRTIFAVATSTMVLLYDTDQLAPFGGLANLHYAPITDIAWSEDGRILVISSEDGYCSVVSFTATDFGTAIPTLSAPQMARPPVTTTKPTIASLLKATPTSTPKALQVRPAAPNDGTPYVGSADNTPLEKSARKQRRITPQLLTPAQPTHQLAGKSGSDPRRITPTLITPTPTSSTRRIVPQQVVIETASRPDAKRTFQEVTADNLGEAKPRRIVPTLIHPRE